MSSNIHQLKYWFEPLREVAQLLPRRLRLPHEAKIALLYSLSIGAALLVIPALAPTSNGTLSQANSILESQTASASGAPAILPGDATGAATPPGYTASFGTFANTYTWGNCTYYVASRRRIPNRWGNAVNWYYAAQRAGYSVGTAPAVGAIAWTSAGWAGHVAVVEAISGGSVRVSEMNYYGYNRIDTRWVAASSFRYIY